MKASTIKLQETYNGISFDKTVSYFIPYDLGVTFGTIYSNFSKWVKRDLKGAVDFKTDYIRTQVYSSQKTLWNKGLLAQASKPVLALQCVIDHASESEVFRHPSNKNFEAIGFLEPDEFTYPLISIEHETDKSKNIEFRMAMKSIRLELYAGVAVASRWQADNIANYWTSKRSTNWYYEFPMVIDFKIPDEIIKAIEKEYNLDSKNHHIFLKWINRNSHGHIYYTMDGYNGKYYYFFRYNANPLIKVLDMNNPVQFDVEGNIKDASFALNRTFEIELLIPSIISASKYGDRITLEDSGFKINENQIKDELTKAHTELNQRYVEIERVFDNKHAYMKIELSWTEDDLVTHKSGDVTTKKFDLHTLIKDDHYMENLLIWAKSKGYKYYDIFNFQLYRHYDYINFIKSINNTKRNVLEGDSDDIIIPDDNIEYEYYIKDISKFTIVDLKPKLNETLVGILYLDLLVKNQFDHYLDKEVTLSYGNDDLGIRLPYGPSNTNKGSDFL